MMLVITVGLLMVVVASVLAPKGQLTHAAVSDRLLRRERSFPWAGSYLDESGKPIPVHGAVLAKAVGDSCQEYGIQDGAIVIADPFEEDGRVEPGQIVIINSPVKDGSRPQRFRRVESVDSGVVHFTSGSRKYQSKPLQDIVGVVRYVSC